MNNEPEPFEDDLDELNQSELPATIDNTLIEELMTLFGGHTFSIDADTRTIIIETYIKGNTKMINLNNILGDEEVREILDVIGGKSNSISLLNLSNHALRQIARKFGINPYQTHEVIKRSTKKRPKGVQEAYEGTSRGRKFRNKRHAKRHSNARQLREFRNKEMYLDSEQ